MLFDAVVGGVGGGCGQFGFEFLPGAVGLFGCGDGVYLFVGTVQGFGPVDGVVFSGLCFPVQFRGAVCVEPEGGDFEAIGRVEGVVAEADFIVVAHVVAIVVVVQFVDNAVVIGVEEVLEGVGGNGAGVEVVVTGGALGGWGGGGDGAEESGGGGGGEAAGGREGGGDKVCACARRCRGEEEEQQAGDDGGERGVVHGGFLSEVCELFGGAVGVFEEEVGAVGVEAGPLTAAEGGAEVEAGSAVGIVRSAYDGGVGAGDAVGDVFSDGYAAEGVGVSDASGGGGVTERGAVVVAGGFVADGDGPERGQGIVTDSGSAGSCIGFMSECDAAGGAGGFASDADDIGLDGVGGADGDAAAVGVDGDVVADVDAAGGGGDGVVGADVDILSCGVEDELGGARAVSVVQRYVNGERIAEDVVAVEGLISADGDVIDEVGEVGAVAVVAGVANGLAFHVEGSADGGGEEGAGYGGDRFGGGEAFAIDGDLEEEGGGGKGGDEGSGGGGCADLCVEEAVDEGECLGFGVEHVAVGGGVDEFKEYGECGVCEGAVFDVASLIVKGFGDLCLCGEKAAGYCCGDDPPYEISAHCGTSCKT